MSAVISSVADRRGIRLGQQVRGGASCLCAGDPLDDRGRVLVAGVEPFQVDEGDAAVAAHADGEVDVGHGVHGRRQERDLQPMPADLDGEVDLGRIQGHGTGNERHLVEAVGAAQPIGGGGEGAAARSSGHGLRYENARNRRVPSRARRNAGG